MRLDKWPNKMKKWVSLNACVYIYEQHFCLKRKTKNQILDATAYPFGVYIYWNTFAELVRV